MKNNLHNISLLKYKDHTVSGEEFNLQYNDKFEMFETIPKPEENKLDKYYQSEDYISHTDGSRSLFEKVYQIIKKYALARKVILINSFKTKNRELLDIGAGTGDFLMMAKKNNWNVVGVEPNKEAINLAEKKDLKLLKDTQKLKQDSFDVITMWHVLEHVFNLEEQIIELKRLIKPNGYIIIAVPNYKSYDATYYKSDWAAYDVPRHLWHFSKKSIEVLFQEQNIILKKVQPMKFDSYYVSLLSEKYKTGKMNFLKALWIGFLSNLKGIKTKEYSSHIYILKNE